MLDCKYTSNEIIGQINTMKDHSNPVLSVLLFVLWKSESDQHFYHSGKCILLKFPEHLSGFYNLCDLQMNQSLKKENILFFYYKHGQY